MIKRTEILTKPEVNMTKPLELADHRPLRMVVYDELKMGILSENILPGTRLMEVELSKRLGVSRTPIREAMRMLEKEGLVAIEARRGAYVLQASPQDIIHTLEARQALDGMLAYYAAKRATPEQIEKIEEAAQAYAQSVKGNVTTESVKLDEAFHLSIAEATQNKTAIVMLEELQEMCQRWRYLYYEHFKNADAMIEEHQELLDVIKRGKPSEAADSAHKHVGNLIKIAQKLFSKEEEKNI